MKGKKLKFGLNNAVVISFCIILVILLNIFVSLLENEIPALKMDLTENAVTRISKETKEILKRADEEDKEIEIIYLKGTGDIPARVKTVLEQYDAYSKKITYRSVNYYNNPVLMKEYGINPEYNAEGGIIVADKDKKKVEFVDKSSIEVSYNNNSVFLLEECVTNAVGMVMRDEEIKVYFSTGHGEIVETLQEYIGGDGEKMQVPGGILLLSLLKNEGIAYEPWDISTGDVPDEADLFIIMAPTDDFTQSEIDRLDDYMKRGGNTAIAFTSGVKMTRLEEYLKLWGLSVRDDIVTERSKDACFDETGIFFYPQLSGHDAVRGISDRILTSYARSMEFKKTGDIEGDCILKTSPSAVSMAVDGSDVTVQGTEGVYEIGYILESPVGGSYENTAKMIVTGSEAVWGVTKYMQDENDFHVYTTLKEARFGNRYFVMNMIGVATGSNLESIYVPIKSESVSTLTMSASEAQIARLVLGFVIPVLVILAGVIVWLKRRNK